MSEFAKAFLRPKDDDAFVPICIIHISIAWYAFAYWLCQPVEPYLLKTLGGDKLSYGYLLTGTNVCSLVGGPFIGWLCDKKGGNIGLVCTLLAGGLSYYMQAVAWNVPMLFLSKAPHVLLHTMHCCQTCVTHLSLSDFRSEALGRLSMSYGIGMVTGSLLGGFSGDHLGYQTNSWISCFVSLSLVPVVLYFLPTRAVWQEDKQELEVENKGWCQSPVYFELLKQPHIMSLLVSYLFVAVALGLHTYTFPNVMMYHFKLTASQQGMVLAAGAVVGTVSSVCLIGPTLSCLGSHRTTVLAMIGTLAVCMTAYAFTGQATLWLFCGLIVPKSMSAAILWTVYTALFTYSVPPKQIGMAIAIGHAGRTAVGIVMPVAANYIYVMYSFTVLSLSGAAVLAVAFTHGIFAVGLKPGHCEDAVTTPLQGASA
eukprot:TRINITY_DN74539_c0_g1_i1.p1 TRINITY_DN74539_c0_g1~~TRINITY_DN74539_c0_g1_i1.p1  ORF type:complete len:425 (-),score=47.11 TRINITY_DN74539_c0_g1_i1:71-1345(-)